MILIDIFEPLLHYYANLNINKNNNNINSLGWEETECHSKMCHHFGM